MSYRPSANAGSTSYGNIRRIEGAKVVTNAFARQCVRLRCDTIHSPQPNQCAVAVTPDPANLQSFSAEGARVADAVRHRNANPPAPINQRLRINHRVGGIRGDKRTGPAKITNRALN
jgi:hypothetical protein